VSGAAVGGLVLVAGLLLAGSPGRRLRRLVVLGGSSPKGRAASGTGRGLGPFAHDPFGARLRRRQAASSVDAAQTVSELAALARAGVPASESWRHVARDCPPTEPWTLVLVAASSASAAGDVPSALRRAAEGCRLPSEAAAARCLAAAWQVAERSGAPMARVLERLADGLRTDADARGARAAAMAGPRATARVLTLLPLAGLLIGQLIGASPVSVLVGTPWGRVCAMAGAVLGGLSAWWTRRLVRAAERAA
jgi:tight adherence protein B